MAATGSNAQIQQDIRDTLDHDVRIDATRITVRVTNDVVRLSGSVPTSFEKVTAGDDAQRIKGVRTVSNDLVVTPSSAWSDDETMRIVREHLERDVRITAPSQIVVTVADGVVTLTGVVPTAAEKIDAADDARTDPGVVDVVNHLTAAPTEGHSDTLIAADVRKKLIEDPVIDASKIDVNVVNGTVFLHGTVATSYEAQCTVRDAWRVTGVRNVVDELSIPL